jgi:hypothetical protein
MFKAAFVGIVAPFAKYEESELSDPALLGPLEALSSLLYPLPAHSSFLLPFSWYTPQTFTGKIQNIVDLPPMLKYVSWMVLGVRNKRMCF